MPYQSRPRWPWLWQGKIGPAFWTIASIFSMVLNLILVVALVLLARQLFTLKTLVNDRVLGGLYWNFQKMDEAHIRTTIPISTSVPAKFDLPLNTITTVVLTEDTVIPDATIYNLDAGALRISQARTTILLPAGSRLPVQLNLTVPVDQQIPVNLTVDVDIPLNQTDLHQPFVGLQDVVSPFYRALLITPNTWQQAVCGPQPSPMCARIFP